MSQNKGTPKGPRLERLLWSGLYLFTPILAVILIPLDFGGGSVLVFASIKELLVAGVAGIGLAILSAWRNQH